MALAASPVTVFNHCVAAYCLPGVTTGRACPILHLPLPEATAAMDWTWMTALLLLMVQDIFSHRRLLFVQQRRRVLAQRLEALSANLPVVVYRARLKRDGQLRLEQVLGDAPQLFSASAAELQAAPHRVLDAVHLADRRPLRAGIEHALRSGQPVRLVFRSRGVKGVRHVAMQAWPLEAEGNRVWNGYWMDDSQAWRRAEATEHERRRAAQQALARDRLLQALESGIKAPMQALAQAVGALQGEALPPAQASAVQALADATRMLAQLMEEAGGSLVPEHAAGPPQCRPAALRPLLEQLHQLLNPVARRKALALELQVSSAVADWLLLDDARLRQVLLNLLGNALKFTTHGAVRLDVEVLDEDLARQRLQLTVSDTGIGIASDRLAQVFEPYRQGARDTARRFGGTGLGLGICRQLVQSMGGQLRLHSQAGVGTEVTVTLDAARAANPAPPPLRTQHTARVLVADDHPAHQLMVQWWLLELGLESTLVADGHQALIAWREGGFALLLCDEQMPGLSGTALAARIRAEEKTSGAPRTVIIGMSADADGVARGHFDRVLTKTGGAAALHAAVAELCPDLIEAGGAPSAPPPSPSQLQLDIRLLQARFGSEERVRELLCTLQSALDEDIQRLQREVRDNQTTAIKARLHRIAGALGSIGSVALADWLRQLQPPLAEPDLQALMKHLQDYLRQLQAATA